jgi:hypothetical protein
MSTHSRAAIAFSVVLSILIFLGCDDEPNGTPCLSLTPTERPPEVESTRTCTSFVKALRYPLKREARYSAQISMTGGRSVRKGEHLLEIHYDIANINSFRNLWEMYQVVNVAQESVTTKSRYD